MSRALIDNLSKPISRGKESWFTLEWSELREIVKRYMSGENFSLTGTNREKFESHTNPRPTFHGYTRNQLERWLEKGFYPDAISGVAIPAPIREKRRYQFVEEGEEILVDRVLSGEDNYMGEFTKRVTIPGATIEACITFQSGVSAEIVNAYNTFVCRAISTLENSGVDCEVTLKFSSGNLWNGSGMTETLVRVKRVNESVDYKSYSPMLSPASYRTFGFLAYVLHAEKRGKQVNHGLGRGHNGKEWKVQYDSDRRVIRFDCPYVPRDFPAGRMESDFRSAVLKLRNG